MSAIEYNGRYVQSSDADATMAGDRAAVFHRGTQSAVTLNPSGTLLWNSLAAPKSVDELVSGLLARFPSLAQDQARTDVDAFLSELLSHKLLQRAD
ncbi:MAG: PqqD family protein [Candidatus Sumerlaeaceae bacterium]